jgi:hypothetical protein
MSASSSGLTRSGISRTDQGPNPTVSLFATPKPFMGMTAIQQRNAIRSWLQLGEAVEVTLVGDDAGTAEIAKELELRHVPAVARDDSGTPLVSSVFQTGVATARAPVLCYVNADIILLPDFLDALRKMRFRKFLMVGRRWDVRLDDPVDFASASWRETLLDYVRREARLHSVTGIDYFAFTRGWLEPMPDFAIGRTIWDNWIIFRARARGVPVVDASDVVTAIHQNHDYGHVAGGVEVVWAGSQAQRNRALAGNMLYPFTIADANWKLASNGPVPRAVTPGQIPRQLGAWAAASMGRQPKLAVLVRQTALTMLGRSPARGKPSTPLDAP